MGNISRHIDYMATNIKYILTQGFEMNKEIFADKFLNKKLYENVKQAKLNNIILTESLGTIYKIMDKVKF